MYGYAHLFHLPKVNLQISIYHKKVKYVNKQIPGILSSEHNRRRESLTRPLTGFKSPVAFLPPYLLAHRSDYAGAHRAAAFADGKAHPCFNGNGGDQLDIHIDVVAGHDHLHALG